MSSQVGPPWTSITTGNGPLPSGTTWKPWTSWPCSLVKCHDDERPAAWRRLAGRRDDRRRRDRPGHVARAWPWEIRYQTSPSGRTRAVQAMVPDRVVDRATGRRSRAVPVEAMASLVKVDEEERSAVRVPVRRPRRPPGRSAGSRWRPSPTGSHSPGRSSPSSSSTIASVGFPAPGAQATAQAPCPRRAAHRRSRRFGSSITRSAGWMRSPCSLCSRHRSEPSGDSPARLKPPVSAPAEPQALVAPSELPDPSAVARDVDGEPGALLIAAATVRGASDNPSFQPLGRPGRNGRPRRRRTGPPASGPTRRRSRPRTRGRRYRRGWGGHPRSRPGGRSPGGRSRSRDRGNGPAPRRSRC